MQSQESRMNRKRERVSLKMLLLSATLLAGAHIARADDGALDNTGQAPLPTGQFITPTFATGSTFTTLSPDLPEYTPAIGNYPNFHPHGAIASTLSPDGKTLAVMTSGYNVLDDANARLVGSGAEFVVLYDVSNPRAPVQKQTLRPANTFVGLAFSPDGTKLYVSGGNDDQVLVYANSASGFAQSAVIDTGHGGPKAKTPGGIGNAQYPQTGGLAVSKDGSLLAVANTLNNSVSVFRTADNAKLFEYDLRPFNTTPGSDGVAGGETLYSVAIKDNSTIYATSLRDREVVVVDFSGGAPRLVTRIPLPGSPNNLVLNKFQDTLYVPQDNSDTVAVIKTATNQVVEQIDAIAPPGVLADKTSRYTGAATNNVALSPDEKTLFITNGGANAVAIVPLTGPAPHRVAGLVPTGWYPTTVTLSADGGTMYVFNSKSDPGGNPKKVTSSVQSLTNFTYPGGNTAALRFNANQYVLQLEQSGMLMAPVPAAGDLANLTTQVAANNGWSVASYPEDVATMDFLQKRIKHVIYIVKENRTFDQILGDLTNGANGDPSLTIFGREITPNFHRISNNFVTLDNFFDSGEVSGNGWPWSTAGRETDWVEKNIPMSYTFAVNRGNAPYDAEGQNSNVSVGYVGSTPNATVVARQESAGGYDYTATGNALGGGAVNLLPGKNDVGAPDGKNGLKQAGYIWSAALRKGLTVRNYGFFSDNSHYGLTPTSPGYSEPLEFPFAAKARQMWTTNPELIPVTDNYFRGFDEAYPDTWRYQEFEREFNQFAAPGNDLPNLVLLRYMRDHMGAFKQSLAGTGTPETQQADNDLAVGRTLDLLAHSRFASDTLVVVLEDDAQDGGDHMDAHRSTAYMVGPYVKRKAVVSTRYSTVNMLRTIEDVLGLEHLNLNTAYQRPMTDVFDITKGRGWTYNAVASTILKGTTLVRLDGDPNGGAVQFAEGPDLQPTHTAAWWAEQTRGFDWSSEDRVPADLFNEVVWEGMKGSEPYPAVRTGLMLGRRAEAPAAAGPAALLP